MRVLRFIGKKWLLLLFIAAFILLYQGYDRVLSIKTAHGIRQARDMYAQPADTIDVAFMGSSHVHCDVSTAVLWEQFGIAAYDYSAAEQPLWTTYYYLKELCKKQEPKLVVLDLYAPARFKEDYQYECMTDNMNGVRFSLNKLRMLASNCEPSKYADYFPSLATYHQRYNDLVKEDFEALFVSRKERAAFKGYTPYFNVVPQTEPVISETKSEGLTEKSEEYLRKIIDYTQKNGIGLLLLVAPHISIPEDEMTYNRIHEIAGECGVGFLNCNHAYDEIGLDFSKDFNDDSHLNYIGSGKFTEYLGKELKSTFDLPDRRGDAKWESWDRNVLEIQREVEEAAAMGKEAALLQ